MSTTAETIIAKANGYQGDDIWNDVFHAVAEDSITGGLIGGNNMTAVALDWDEAPTGTSVLLSGPIIRFAESEHRWFAPNSDSPTVRAWIVSLAQDRQSTDDHIAVDAGDRWYVVAVTACEDQAAYDAAISDALGFGSRVAVEWA